MKALVLHKQSFSPRVYSDVLGDGATLLCDADLEGRWSADDLSPFRAVHHVPQWRASSAPDLLAAQLMAAERFDAVVALGESDQMRAAELRAAFAIGPGLRPVPARRYRDKAEMGALARDGGIRTPLTRPASSITEVLEAADLIGYPLILKPRSGSGTVGVVKIEDRPALDRWLDRTTRPRNEPLPYLAQAWVDQPLYVVDGVVAEGDVVDSWVSSYGRPTLEWLEGGVRTLASIDPASATSARLRSFATDVIAALDPERDQSHVFHLEAFCGPELEPTLCEVACRPGGGPVSTIAEAHGWDLRRTAVALQAGLAPSRRHDRAEQGSLGGVLIARQGGLLVAAPDRCDVPGSLRIDLAVTPGARYEPSHKSADVAAVVIGQTASREAFEDFGLAVTSWAAQAFCWQEA